MRIGCGENLHGTPGGGEAENEETCEADHGGSCWFRVCWVLAVECKVTDGCENQEADEHPCRACEERFAASVVLDDVEAIEGDAEVDAVLCVMRE
jgi:hypothetical protein